MKLRDMKTFDAVLAEDLKDPEFRARWERTALARAVANASSAIGPSAASRRARWRSSLG